MPSCLNSEGEYIYPGQLEGVMKTFKKQCHYNISLVPSPSIAANTAQCKWSIQVMRNCPWGLQKQLSGHEATEVSSSSNFGMWVAKLQKLQPAFAVSQLIFHNKDHGDCSLHRPLKVRQYFMTRLYFFNSICTSGEISLSSWGIIGMHPQQHLV